MMLWGVIGVLVGLVMGLTGAGGASIAVPMFTSFGGYSVHEATTLSLAVVFVGATLNWAFQYKQAYYSYCLPVALLSFLGSYLFADVKQITHPHVILALFVSICLGSLYSVWKTRPQEEKTSQYRSPLSVAIKIGVGGLTLGALTTMTGLGGGVLLVPFYLGWMRLSLEKSVSSSLLTISLAAAGSMTSQRDFLFELVHLKDLAFLAVGTVSAAIALRTTLAKLGASNMAIVRKVFLSAILLIAVFGTIAVEFSTG